jgi:uncharacterized protein
MPVLRKQLPAQPQDRGMDEILASIRRIIDEEPLNAPFHAGAIGGAAADRSVYQRRGAELRAAEAHPETKFGTRATEAAADDDVLAELLAPGALAHAAIAGGIGTEQQSSPAEITERVSAALEPIAVEPIDVAPVPAAPPVASEVSPAVSTQGPALASNFGKMIAEGSTATAAGPNADLPSADDVLAALARGLAEPAVVVVAPVTLPEAALLSEVAPCAASSEYAEGASEAESKTEPVAEPVRVAISAALAECDTSPAEAVAAAVAAVAAVNAAAVHTGARQRIVAAPKEALVAVQAAEINGAAIVIAAEPELKTEPVPVVLMASVPVEIAPPELIAPVLVIAAAAAGPDALAPEMVAVAPATVAPSTELVPQAPASFEDAISAMLRPMLRDWLDDNMPRMVEKALKEEIAGSGGVVAHAARLARPDAA